MAKDLTGITKESVLAFTETLSTQDPDKFIPRDYQRIAQYINSDGCTLVTQIYKAACIEHDWYYVTGRDFMGETISRKEADRLLRVRLQKLSPLKVASPISWIRWVGVRIGGHFFWTNK